MGGPFNSQAGPQFGYQLPFTPADLFRHAIRAITRMKAFTGMSPSEQDEFLRTELEGGGLGDLDGVPAKVFFAQLRTMAVQGYFSDPSYGGNKDMVAWRAIGFPGAYAGLISQHGKRFDIGPFSIADHDKIPEHDMSSMEQQQ